MLRITENGSNGKVWMDVVESNTRYFSAVSTEINGSPVRFVVNHGYDIPRGYCISGAKITNIKVGTKVVTCDVILPNDKVLTKAMLDVRGTIGVWLGDLREGNARYATATNKELLLSNLVLILGDDIEDVESKATMYMSHESGVKRKPSKSEDPEFDRDIVRWSKEGGAK